jgi:predicted MFS family arabinose efflux permease
MAMWIIVYGVVQAAAPSFVRGRMQQAPGGHTARNWVLYLFVVTVAIAIALGYQQGAWFLLIGLAVFGAVFAVNSSVHSYLILAYTHRDQVAANVGFYYMANAGGRLLGSLLSGLCYQYYGIQGCLWGAGLFLFLSLLLSSKLANTRTAVSQI